MAGGRAWRSGRALACSIAAVAIAAGGADAQYDDPMPPPERPPRETTVTLSASREDGTFRQRVVLTGRVDPPPPSGTRLEVNGQTIPEIRYDDPEYVGAPAIRPDGTFEIAHRPATNKRYYAMVDHPDLNRAVVSNQAVVYTDYGLISGWRRLRGSRLELAMLIKANLGVGYGLKTFVGRPAWFYGFRRGDRSARRLGGARMFATDDTSSAHPAAYTKKRVRRARRIRFVFACVPERRPDVWGRFDDPIQRQCGRRRVRLPLGG